MLCLCCHVLDAHLLVQLKDKVCKLDSATEYCHAGSIVAASPLRCYSWKVARVCAMSKTVKLGFLALLSRTNAETASQSPLLIVHA